MEDSTLGEVDVKIVQDIIQTVINSGNSTITFEYLVTGAFPELYKTLDKKIKDYYTKSNIDGSNKRKREKI